jgi:hypothetical protein
VALIRSRVEQLEQREEDFFPTSSLLLERFMTQFSWQWFSPKTWPTSWMASLARIV